MNKIANFISSAFGEYSHLLNDKRIVEFSANQNGCVYVERLGEDPEYIGDMDVDARERVIRYCATACGIPVTDEAPIVSAKMPDTGFRFEGVKPPAVEAPLFSIRFHAVRILRMDDYVSDGTVTNTQANDILQAIKEKKNIVVAGGTGSGKTTFLNMLIGELNTQSPKERLIVIEDTPEIKTQNNNTVFLKTTKDVDMTRLLASSLRLRPDRIIVGEVRDGAALAMIKAWNTGHPGGFTSVHADSAKATLTRVDMLIREASAMPLPEVIGLGIDLIIFIKANKQGRKVTEIVEIKGYKDGEYIYD